MIEHLWLEEKQEQLNKLFRYFYNQIDLMKVNGEINSKLEKIESIDDLIHYYENEMIITTKRY